MGARAGRSRWLGLLLCLAAAPAAAQGPDRLQAGNAAHPEDTSAVDWPDEQPPELPLDLPGEIQLTEFTASAFAQHLSGDLLWLAGPEGILRVEIRAADGAPDSAAVLAALLDQQGEGWSAVLAGRGNDTFNAWGEQWRRAPAGLAELVLLLRTRLEAGPPSWTAVAGPWRARCRRPGPVRHRIPALAAEPLAGPEAGFRTDLVRRGAGRSAAEEVVELAWLEAGAGGGPRLEVRATGRPGALSLAVPRPLRVIYAMPEAFVPLWPLSDLVSFQP